MNNLFSQFYKVILAPFVVLIRSFDFPGIVQTVIIPDSWYLIDTKLIILSVSSINIFLIVSVHNIDIIANVAT